MIDLRSAVVTVISNCLAVPAGEDVLLTVGQWETDDRGGSAGLGEG